MCVGVCLHIVRDPSLYQSRGPIEVRTSSDLLELELHTGVSCHVSVGAKPWSSARIASAFVF